MRRSSGILMHISSLPGPYGVGCFGQEALDFAQLLVEAGVRYWQVLPFSIPGSGDSPYMSLSAFAGNPMLIDPDALMRQELINEQERSEAELLANPKHADFKGCRQNRSILLRKAYARAGDSMMKEVESFIRARDWVDDLALFLLIRKQYEGVYWWRWPDEEIRMHDPYSLAVLRDRYYSEYLYYCFVQYIFFTQWNKLKAKMNEIGIQIIGDIPIYVSKDSVDVWANRHLFQIDEDLHFPRVAGVPPDYFSTKGQLWGNPLYDWKSHADEDYRWWQNRLSNNFELFDLLRIDHFRAFSSYWSIPSNYDDAVIGNWVQGPGLFFFDRMRLEHPNPPIFAEDLGEQTEDLAEFLNSVGFPGMRVFQFGFDGEEDNKHRPHDYPKSCIAYSGTHDNDTLLGWFHALPAKTAQRIAEYCGLEMNCCGKEKDEYFCKGVIRTILQSHADIAIFPIQDLLYLDGSRRMNTPGTQNGNWGVRFTKEELGRVDSGWMRRMNQLFGRI